MNYFSRFLFGSDIFISYSRADAGNYAERLAIGLQELKYRCYIDRWDTRPGKTLPRGLIRKLKHSSMLVVLGTEGAINSLPIAEEIAIFSKLSRIIVPVDLGHLEKATWLEHLVGLPVIAEESANRMSNKPSDEVKESIVQAFTYQTLNKRQRRAIMFTASFLSLLLVLTGISILNLYHLQIENKRQSSENGQLNKSIASLRSDSLVLNDSNTKLKKDSAALERDKNNLRNENDMAKQQLSEKQKELKETAVKMKLLKARAETDGNLAKSILADARNVPKDSYAFADSAHQIEYRNGFTPAYSSLLLSKAANRGIPRLLKSPLVMNEFKTMDSGLFYISYRGGCLQKINADGQPGEKMTGVFRGLNGQAASGHLFTCLFNDVSQQIDLVELDNHLQVLKKTTVLSMSDWPEKVVWASIRQYIFELTCSNISGEISLKVMKPGRFQNPPQLMYQFYLDWSAPGKIQAVHIPKPHTYNENLVSETIFTDSSRSVYTLNHNIYLHNFLANQLRRVDCFSPGNFGQRGDDPGPRIMDDLIAYDRNGLLAYASESTIEFLTINADSCRFNKVFMLPRNAKLHHIQFIADTKLLLVFRNINDQSYYLDLLKIDTSARDTLQPRTTQWSVSVEKDAHNNDYYKLDIAGSVKLNQKFGIRQVLYDSASLSAVVIGNDGLTEIINLSNSQVSALYGIQKIPAAVDYNNDSKQLALVRDTSTIEIWDLRHYLPSGLAYYGWPSSYPGEITSLLKTDTKGNRNFSDTIIGLGENNGNKYVFQLYHPNNSTVSYLDSYCNSKLDTSVVVNPNASCAFISSAGLIAIQERMESWFNDKNEGKVTAQNHDENRVIKLFYPFTHDSLNVYSRGQLSGQSFSKAGDWIKLKDGLPEKKSMPELKEGAIIAKGIISPDGKYYCDYEKDSLQIWDLLSKTCRKLHMDSLHYMEFIPAGNMLVCVSRGTVYSDSRFYTIELSKGSVAGDFSIRLPAFADPGLTDSLLYLKYNGETGFRPVEIFKDRLDIQPLLIFNLFTGQRTVYRSNQSIEKFLVSHHKNWTAYTTTNIKRMSLGLHTESLRIGSFSDPGLFAEYSFSEKIDDMFFSPDDRYLLVHCGVSTYKLTTPAAFDAHQTKMLPLAGR